MGRVKEWWMSQIEEVCDQYASKLHTPEEQEAYKRSLENLTLLGLDVETAREHLDAVWFEPKP